MNSKARADVNLFGYEFESAPMEGRDVSAHHVLFYKDRAKAGWIARCKCGFEHHADTLLECQTKSATHDL